MVSNHFPTLYGEPVELGALLVIVAAGALVRHVLNFGSRSRVGSRLSPRRWCVERRCALRILAIAARRHATHVHGSVGVPATVTFDDARHVIDRRCAVCHSAQPIDSTFGVAPAGVMFDTPEQIVARASRIQERAVVTRTMPPGNKTNISDVERAILARWIEGGRERTVRTLTLRHNTGTNGELQIPRLARDDMAARCRACAVRRSRAVRQPRAPLWHLRSLAPALFGACALWHLRSLAPALFGTCALWHLRRQSFF